MNSYLMKTFRKSLCHHQYAMISIFPEMKFRKTTIYMIKVRFLISLLMFRSKSVLCSMHKVNTMLSGIIAAFSTKTNIYSIFSMSFIRWIHYSIFYYYFHMVQLYHQWKFISNSEYNFHNINYLNILWKTKYISFSVVGVVMLLYSSSIYILCSKCMNGSIICQHILQ